LDANGYAISDAIIIILGGERAVIRHHVAADPPLLTRNCASAPTQKKRTTCMVLGMSSHLDRPKRHDRRKNFRLGWHLPATIYDAGRHLERPCILVDLSNRGAKIAGVRAHTIPDEFRLRTPIGDRRSCRVIWRTEDTLGVEFTDLDGADNSGRSAGREPTHA
jgi:hypothetical protein